jgi:hypothetical protein
MKSTKIITKDGEEIVLFHEEDITEEEIEAFEEFTKEEIKLLCKMWGFKEFQL